MTPPSSIQTAAPGSTAVLEAPPQRKRSNGRTPPPRDPDDGDRGRGGGDEGGGGWESFADDRGSFALVLALIGIGTLFAVLIAVWLFLRRPAPDWRGGSAGGALDALWISSACLLLSSLAIERAARVARSAREPRARTLRWIGASIGLGLAFVAAQLQLWTTLWRAGLVPSSSGYAAVFFALTGLHALHVLGGLGFLAFLGSRHRRRAVPPPNDPPPRAASVRLGAIYWHFMGALWLVLFGLLYFVR